MSKRARDAEREKHGGREREGETWLERQNDKTT